MQRLSWYLPLGQVVISSMLVVLAGCTPLPDKIDQTEEVRIPSGRVLQYGVYKVLRSGRIINNPDSSTGKLIRKPTIELAEQTRRVPIQKGLHFAFQYRLSNFSKGQYQVTLRRVVKHPKMTRPDGTKFSSSDYLIRKPVKRGEVFDLDGYAFSEDYELVAGNWVFQLWYKDKLLIEQKFTSYWPEQAKY